MSEPRDKSLAQEMAERLAAEQAASQPPAEPAISFQDVVAAMWRGEKGDGELFARLLAGKLANAPELKGQWLKWGGVTWQDAHIHEVEKEVERVAALYDEARIHFQEELKTLHPAANKEECQRLEHLINGLRAAVRRNRSRKGISNTCRLALNRRWPGTD